MHSRLTGFFLATLAIPAAAPGADSGITSAQLDAAAKAIEPKTIERRRDFHAHPELSNREVRTAEQIAKQLRALGIETKTGVGVTGVVGLLRGGKPGRTVGLRADMDALPVTEQTDVPFKSKATAQFRGETVGVMHACGHDSHVAILLASPKCWRACATGWPGKCCSCSSRPKKARPRASAAAPT